MNSLPGPDKGLFDILFGSKTAEPQAPQQAVLPGEQAQVAGIAPGIEDFMNAMAKAQDQTAASAQVAVQPKGGSPDKNLKPSIPVQAEQTPVLPVAQQATQKPAVKADVKSEKKTEQSKAALAEHVQPSQKPKAKAAPSVLQEAQAAAALAAQQAHAQPALQDYQAQPAVGGETLSKRQAGAKAQPQVQGQLGPKAPVTTTLESIQDNALLQQAVAQAAETPAAPKARATEQASSTQTPAVVQPIVIQVPVAMPMAMAMPIPAMEVVEASDEQQAPVAIETGRSSKNLVSSQDFLANRRGSILGVDREDPRLVSRASLEAVGSEEKSGGLNGRSDLAHFIPLSQREEKVVASAVHSTAPRVEISQPMNIASQVTGLMARGGGTVKVRIAPENLGEMTISVQTKGRHLDVKFEAGSKEAREALLGAVPQLREALSSSKFEVGSIEVAKPSGATSETLFGGGFGSMQLSNGGSMMSMLMNNDSSFSDQGQGQPNQHQHEQGSAWDRYNDQRESGQGRGQGRQRESAYQRYQDALGA